MAALLRMWGRAPITRVPSAGPLGAKKPPHQTTDDGNQRGSWRGWSWAPGSPGCTCQGSEAPCDGLSVFPPPVLPVFAVEPVTPFLPGP